MAEKIIISIENIDKLVLPDGYKLTKVKTKKEEKAELQNQIKEFKLIKEPSDEELIEEGRISHLYYINQMMIKDLEEQIKALE